MIGYIAADLTLQMLESKNYWKLLKRYLPVTTGCLNLSQPVDHFPCSYIWIENMCQEKVDRYQQKQIIDN